MPSGQNQMNGILSVAVPCSACVIPLCISVSTLRSTGQLGNGMRSQPRKRIRWRCFLTATGSIGRTR